MVIELRIELRGRHNDRLVHIDTRDYPLCEGIFIGTVPSDERREHFATRAALQEWKPNRKIAELPEQPAEVR